jgi:hypothetical protein
LPRAQRPAGALSNGAPDAGAVYTYRPLIDCDNDGLDDPAELAQGGNDCNGNFVPDAWEGDVNQDGVADACQSGGATFCAGDDSGTACPCGNSVNAQGARLVASGLPSVLNDSLVLSGSGMTPSSSVLYFQGTTQGAGAVFGDGLRCATGTIIRLGTTTNANGASSWPVPGAQSISVRGAIPAGGSVQRAYQAWYRDANATYCTDTARFNLTNGVRVQWVL